MCAYGVVDDLVDEYMRMSEPTCFESMYMFCKGVIHVFAREYLIETNVAGYCQSMSQDDFLVCLKSIDCMNGEWKSCQFVWEGQYQGHAGGCTVIHETVADIWICPSILGMEGSRNNNNVL
jgi:hypothetical protein